MWDLIGDLIKFVSELGMTDGDSGLHGKQRALAALMIVAIVGALVAGAVLFASQRYGLGTFLVVVGLLGIGAQIFLQYRWAKPKKQSMEDVDR